MKDTRLVHGLVCKAVEIHERVIELRAKLLARTVSAQCARVEAISLDLWLLYLLIWKLFIMAVSKCGCCRRRRASEKTSANYCL